MIFIYNKTIISIPNVKHPIVVTFIVMIELKYLNIPALTFYE